MFTGAFRLMLADIRDAITTVIGAHQEIADDDLAQIVRAMLNAEKQYLREVAGLDDDELARGLPSAPAARSALRHRRCSARSGIRRGGGDEPTLSRHNPLAAPRHIPVHPV